MRLELCEMFGGDTDDPFVIYDPDKFWEDRLGEGIAETFKDAFLPQRYRRYANRTRRKIPLYLYPEFRRLFRGLAGGFNYVYGSSAWRVDLTKYGITLPTHLSPNDPEAFVFFQEYEDFPQCWGVDMSQFKESGELPFSMEIPDGGPTEV